MILGFFIGKRKPKFSEHIALPLIKYGIPLSVMGLLLKEGIDLDLIRGRAIVSESFGFLFPIKKPKIKKGTIFIKRAKIVLIYF